MKKYRVPHEIVTGTYFFFRKMIEFFFGFTSYVGLKKTIKSSCIACYRVMHDGYFWTRAMHDKMQENRGVRVPSGMQPICRRLVAKPDKVIKMHAAS